MGDKFQNVVDAYLNSSKFASLKPNTQSIWKRYLLFACEFIGDCSADEIRPSIIQKYLDGLSGRPGTQCVSLTAFKALEKWAIVRDLLTRPIALGVETGKPTGGHIPWTDEQVSLSERYARNDIARLITLGANSGQRGSDLIRMGWGDLETFQGRTGINVRQKKTGREVWIPILEPLAKAMASWEKRPGPFCLHRNGKPWTRAQLSWEWNWERAHNPALKPLDGLVMHGLRAHACVKLYRAGCTTRQVADMVGMSTGMVERYCRLSVQRENAIAAVIQLEGYERGTNARKFDADSK